MRRVAAAAVVVLLALAFAVVQRDATEPIALGVASGEASAVAAFRQTTGARPHIYVWYQAWEGSPSFDAERASAVSADGALPMLTWEPWAPGAGTEQPAYALDRIVAGDYDPYIRAFARDVRDWDGVLALRFAHELNAPHYPWSVGVNGNTAGDARTAWAHVREIFEREGARNVVWVWCVNVHAEGTEPYEDLFPGDDLVDWAALDGYNGGDALPWGGWRSPSEVFAASVKDLKELSDRPLVITETASAEQGGDKAAWIRELFAFAESEGIRALVWFDVAKEADWRIDSSPASAAAFRREASVDDRLGAPPLPDGLEVKSED